MAANVANSSTFHIPDTAIKIQIPISDETLNQMRIHNFHISQKYPQDYEKMRRTVEKVAPYALVLLGTIVTSPVWIPCTFIAQLILGPFAFVAAGAIGYGLVKTSEKICQAFYRQIPEISGFIAAKLTNILQNSQENHQGSHRDSTSYFHDLRSRLA
jgi:hypothetical protein